MPSRSIKGAALASAAAGLFVLGSTVATPSFGQAADTKVACEGVNACKGTSDCKTAKSSCKGQNACKGTGVKQMTQADCDKAKTAAKKS